MIKENKWKLILSSIMILLPMIVGIILWNELPEMMTTHWGTDGNANGWSSKWFAVFGVPLILLGVQWLCIFITAKDPKNKNQNNKVLGLVLWIMPIVSIFANAISYTVAFGKEISVGMLTFGLVGFVFVIVGNYLPKCKQNYTIGIKIKWTLANEENWNVTHRVAGKIWVVGGMFLMMCMFLPEEMASWILTFGIFGMVLVPIIYSYLYYRKQVTAGTAPKKAIVTLPYGGKWVRRISLIIVTILIIFANFINFTGDVMIEYNDTSFTINTGYWKDLSVEYNAIDTIEYRENYEEGTKVNGFSSSRLLLGNFENDEFGKYTLYAYTKCKACVVLKVDNKILVIAAEDEERTIELYEKLLENL